MVKHNKNMPFSIRYQDELRMGLIKINISKEARYQLFAHLNSYNDNRYFPSGNGFYHKRVSTLALEAMIKFYIPLSYSLEDEKEVEATTFLELINAKPHIILDAIEFFIKNIEEAEDIKRCKLEIESIFEIHKLNLKFDENIIVPIKKELKNYKVNNFSIEQKVEEYIKKADDLYNKGDSDLAVEKIWDAFERIKTYFCPEFDLNKKESANEIIKVLACGNKEFGLVFEQEFFELTNIGNKFMIRHHETDKIEINDNLHYEYLYKRCLSLVIIILEKLNELELSKNKNN
ncbi:MAG TPA: hypothetical protein PLT60_03605 [Candidatus Pacearchaeota archaeon]|jgi:hypothetical protein|nr:hypothetical protein [Candidatus Pacearchaeota archaeon]